MRNPENAPTHHILPDGRRVPSTKGLLHTDEERMKMSRALTGKQKSELSVRGRSTVWNRVRPLVQQQLQIRDIVEAIGLTAKQVGGAINRKGRPEWHRIIQGYSTPEKANERRSRALKGRPRSPESVMKGSIVWRKVGPLCSRGALAQEIAPIIKVSKSKVQTAMGRNNRRPEATRVEPFGGLDRIARIKRARRLTEAHRIPASEDEKKDLEFAQKLFEADFITFDIGIWEKLHELYGKSKRSLPDSFAKRLRLEVFLRARLDADNGDKELMDKYFEWGLGIDKDWFGELAAEEEFIARTVGEKRDKDEIFLDEFLRVRKECAKTGDTRVFNELAPLLQQDPTITTRLAPQMAKIIKATPSEVKKNNHGVPIVNGEMSWDDIMGR